MCWDDYEDQRAPQLHLINEKMTECYRCNSKLKDVTPKDIENIHFFEYLECHSRYAQKPGQQLHDRWLMPLTLILYEVIFSENPPDHAKELLNEKGRFDVKKKDILISHIRGELDTPNQKISEIFDFVCNDETKLREYLRLVMEGLENEIRV